MLRSFREMLGSRLTAQNELCGKIKDFYFDDGSWALRYLVASVGIQRNGDNLRLIEPGQIFSVEENRQLVHLDIPISALGELPPANAVKPVCKQYEELAQGSPGARGSLGLIRRSDPRLRSCRIVGTYPIEYAGQVEGHLEDFLFDDRSWTLRYFRIVQKFDGKALRFHIVPHSIERISWAAQRIYLKELKPVHLEQSVDVELIPLPRLVAV